MSRVVGVLGSLVVVAGAAAAAEGEPGRKPLFDRAMEAANPYVSAANDALGGAASAIEGSKELRASQVSREWGNRAARKEWADTHNGLRARGQGVVKAIEKVKLGTMTSIADVGGTLAGHLVEGDFRAVPGVTANAAAKNVTSAGGAWAGGAAGAAVGSFFGPVGTLVGGAVGAAAGAVGASLGYDATSDALARNGYHNVQSYVDSLAAEMPVDYVEKARQARREFLEAREDERRRSEKRRSEELGDYVEQARRARREHLEESARRDAEAQEWRERQDRRTDAGSDTQSTASRSDAAIPVIPVDCTIDVVMWTKASPSLKWHGSFQVNGDSVTGRGELRSPRGGGLAAVVWIDEFTGTRHDNVITGTSRGRMERVREEIRSSDGVCVMEWWSSNTARDEWTFELGGTGSVSVQVSGTNTYQYMSGCSNPGTRTQHYDTSTSADETVITWKIR